MRRVRRAFSVSRIRVIMGFLFRNPINPSGIHGPPPESVAHQPPSSRHPPCRSPRAIMKIAVVGLNHKTTPVAMRERLAVAPAEIPACLRELMALEGIDEGALVSTCNRVEVYFICHDPDSGFAAISDWLAQRSHLEPDDLLPHLYSHNGEEAIRHGFRVAASLDSLVVGETQILGQMKQAYRDALASKSVGQVLSRFFHQAFQTAKRVRTETDIARNPVSIASAAVSLAGRIFGNLEGHTCLLIGAGEMCELAARHLVGHGVGILVANRTRSRAEALAETFDGQAYSLDDLATILHKADILIASTGASGHLVSAAMVRGALKERRQRPQFYIDIAVPRDLDPDIGAVDNAYLYDIDDLTQIVENNREGRGEAVIEAEKMIDEAAPAFVRWMGTLDVVPTIVALRKKLEAIRDRELTRTANGWPELTADERQRLDALGRLLVNKILHGPLSRLKEMAAETDGDLYVDTVRRLFDLDGPPPGGR